MSDLITMTCPSCGAKLRVAADAATLLCGHCGSEYRVRHGDGATYLAPMAQDVRQIRVSSDKTAAELAVARLDREIKELETEAEKTSVHVLESRARQSEQERSLTILGIALLILSSMIRATTSGPLPGFFSWISVISVISVALIVIALALFTYRRHRLFSWRTRELSRLNAEIGKRQSRLEKNRAIAEG